MRDCRGGSRGNGEMDRERREGREMGNQLNIQQRTESEGGGRPAGGMVGSGRFGAMSRPLS